MEEVKFRVNYDDSQMDVVEIISNKLKEFGLAITELEDGDGWMEYQIVKTEN